MDVSFGTIWEAVAARIPGAVAISEPGRDLTYAEFEDQAARLAAALAGAGVGPGDKVACYLYNGSAYLVTVFAAFKLGAVAVNANYRYTRDELTELLVDADAAALVFSGALAANVAHAAANVPTLRLVVQAGPAPEGGEDAAGGGGPAAVDMAELPPPAAGGGGPAAVDMAELLATTPPRPREPRPGSDQLFMYTGGTTGRPKGVIWQHTALLNCLTVPVFGPLGRTTLPASLEEAVEIAIEANARGTAPATLPVAPLMHATGLFNTMGALLVGGRAILLRPGRLDPRHVWETVAAQRAGMLIVAGNAMTQPLVDELIAAEQAGRPYDLSSLRSVLSSGTVLSDRLKRALHERANVTIRDAIASSEGGPFAFALTTGVDDLPSRFFLVPGGKVIGEDDREVEPGSGRTGVLAYSGPMPLGYYKDSARTSTTYRVIDGVRYAIPGDLALLDADGSVRFLGRGSGVINTGGEKVHPQEVENALLRHPKVTDCVVVGVPDETWGERVAAVVAVTDPAGVTEEELRDQVRATLAGYKVPRHIVLVDRLPRTPTGKIEMAWARSVAADAAAAVRG